MVKKTQGNIKRYSLKDVGNNWSRILKHVLEKMSMKMWTRLKVVLLWKRLWILLFH